MNPGGRRASRGVTLWVSIFLMMLWGCSPVADEVAEGQLQEPSSQYVQYTRLSLPATFVGSIPCEDCVRVDIVLNLRPDQLYQLRKTYISSGQRVKKVESQMRNWRYSSDGRMIILGKQKGMLKTYVVADDNTLVFLELESERGKDPITYTLTRSPGYDPFSDSVKMLGMFSLSESGGTIIECSSGEVFSVSRSGDFERMAKEYLRMPHNQSEPLLLSFTGTIHGTGESFGDSITINDFNRLYLNGNCLGEQQSKSLTDSVWTLETIGNRDMAGYEYRSAPYLILRRDNTLQGFAGCNDISGTYLVRGDVLLFKRMIQTRLACFEGNELESLFLETLDNAELFTIEEETMTILDQNGEVLATFTGT